MVVVVVVAVGGGGGEGGEGKGGGENVCGDEWQAVVRKEDVRATEKDKVVCAEGFRVGDVVRGVVVSASFLFFSSFVLGGRGWDCVWEMEGGGSVRCVRKGG